MKNEAMEAIHFEATVSNDGTIRVPEGVCVPPGPAKVTVEPTTSSPASPAANQLIPDPAQYTDLGKWLYACGKAAEQWETELPSDLAENHDFYKHRKPRE